MFRKAASSRLLILVSILGSAGPAAAQEPGQPRPSVEDLQRRINQLEDRIEYLEKEGAPAVTSKKEIEKVVRDEVKKQYARGILTFGNAELRLGGKLELNFIDVENEHFVTPFGSVLSTDNADPHLVLDRIRLEPRLDVGKMVEIRGQIDLLPADGQSLLKEAVFANEIRFEDIREDLWWLRSQAQIGLDDPFIHTGPSQRVTELYPLIGTAFWRDEEIAFMWEGTIGDKRGAPAPRQPSGRGAARASGQAKDPSPFSSSTQWQPQDFFSNPGALKLHFSVGDGLTLNEKEIAKGRGPLSEIVQDDRTVRGDGLSLRNFGFGIGYERDFNWLGELGILLFYYDDQLNRDSVDFLQQDLTLFDGTGAFVAGYGSSNKRVRNRLGITIDYHLEGYHLLYSFMDTLPDDGLYLRFQWIEARDGALRRDGWYVQGSYRFSFPHPLIADTFIRYIEPVVRYGVLDVDLPSVSPQDEVPDIPGTWDRREFLIGTVIGVTGKILVKAEYLFNREETGDGSVDNNELLVQLLIEF